jgi:uncharacterized protein YjbI with pentapeptide repeats
MGGGGGDDGQPAGERQPARFTAGEGQPARLAAAATATATALGLLLSPFPAFAGLNPLEAELGGEFGVGTAQQWGEATIDGKNFDNQDLRRSNFTSASIKKGSFRGAKLNGAYFIKSVVPFVDFTAADISDCLFDRAVAVNANFTNAILQRVVFTRSDLTGSIIEGADFTNSMIDKTQQIALCRYASGTNPVTGVDTRKSLGCGSKRRYAASTPSNPEGPQVAEDEKEAFRASMPVYRQ